ncbi:MAG: amidohydrolase family protein [Gemmatimonadales bacterium]
MSKRHGRKSVVGGLILTSMALWAAGCAKTAGPPATDATAFVNVNVVDIAEGRIEPAQTVVVSGGRITRVAADQPPSGARTIDGTGRYLIPGLMDMHTHLMNEDQLVLYLANGVTTVRNMSGDSMALAWREAVTAGKLMGPRIVTAGPIIDGKPKIWTFGVEVDDPAVIDTMIKHQKEAGYDLVKVYSRLSPQVFDAIIAAGRKYGIEVSGHVPQDVPLASAIESGMRSAEHFIGVMKAVLEDGATASPDLAVLDPRAKGVVVGWGKNQVDVATLIDSGKVAALGALARKSDFWFDPTHDIMRNFTSRPVTGHPDALRFMSPPELAMMKNVQKMFGLTPEMLAGEDRSYAVRTTLVAALHRAGAKVVAGTDNAILNGWALKDEIVALSKAGLGNAEALRAATLAPAQYLRKQGELGEVKEGAVADLVLLSGNPIENLDALYRPVGVMAGGVWRTAADFAPLLDSIAAKKAAETTMTVPAEIRK